MMPGGAARTGAVAVALALAVAAALAPVAAADAAIVRVEFTGVVAGRSPVPGGSLLPPELVANRPFQGSLLYDTSVVDSDPSARRGLYLGALLDFDLVFGGPTSYVLPIDLGRATLNQAIVADDVTVTASPPAPPAPMTIDGLSFGVFDAIEGLVAPQGFGIALTLATNTRELSTLTSDALRADLVTAFPPPASPLSPWTASLAVVPIGGGRVSDAVTMSVQSIGARVVPEPATLALLGFGLAGLGALRRRR